MDNDQSKPVLLREFDQFLVILALNLHTCIISRVNVIKSFQVDTSTVTKVKSSRGSQSKIVNSTSAGEELV